MSAPRIVRGRGTPPPDAEGVRVYAGLDEAGYGPMLGPLTIGFSAFRSRDNDGARARSVDWERLRTAVSDDPKEDRERLVVADSKRVYTRNPRGAARLEATALAFLRAAAQSAEAPLSSIAGADLLASAPAPLRPSDAVLARHPWYDALPNALPIHVDSNRLRAAEERLADTLEDESVDVASAGVVVVPAGALNDSFAATGNKGATLWSINSGVILDLFERFGGEGLDFTVDRLGGRARYGRMLSELIPFSSVRVLSESSYESHYDVQSENRTMRIRFVQKGDATSLPVALASCLAKYARELVMDAFNSHFEGACPGVRPTAGYVTDARRWIDEVERLAPTILANRDSLVRTR